MLRRGLILLVWLLLPATTLARPAAPWSHLKVDKPDQDVSEALLTSWIIHGDPVRYCVFIEAGASITKESANIQVRSAVRNWLESIHLYDPKNRVFDREGVPIDLDRVEVSELKCKLVHEKGESNYHVVGIDPHGESIDKRKFLSIFFLREEGRSNYTQSVDFDFSVHATEPRLRIFYAGHPRIKIFQNDLDLYHVTKDESRMEWEELLTEEVYRTVETEESSDPFFTYSSQIFCHRYGDSDCNWNNSFATLLHELGHAFGLGDEYEGGLQPYNDPNHMSALTNVSVMRECDLFFPTKDDVVGLSYFFDRLSGRDYSERIFHFNDFPKPQYAQRLKNVFLGAKKNVSEGSYQPAISGTRGTLHTTDLRLGREATDIQIANTTYDDFEKKVLPKLIWHDTELRKKGMAVTSLALTNSQLQAMPRGIANLTGLIELRMVLNELEEIPPEIGRLKNLERLFLRQNQIFSLPPEIAQLQKLQWLDLSSNQLDTLPPQIGQLQNLQGLELSENSIVSLPSTLENLTKLHTLGASLAVASMPQVVTRLTGLVHLYLSHGKLESCPKEIGNLVHLEELWLGSNALTTLPKEIGRLQKLKTLSLLDNPIQTLPPELKNLPNLKWLMVDDTDLDEASMDLLDDLREKGVEVNCE